MIKYLYVPGLTESVEEELQEIRKRKSNDVERVITETGAVKKKIITKDHGQKRVRKVDVRDFQIPAWEKYALTIHEAAEYYNIAESKLRDYVQVNRDKIFVLKAGGRLLIKRKIFECYLDKEQKI